MQIQLNPEDEAAIFKEIEAGRFHSLQDAVAEAVHIGLSVMALEDTAEASDSTHAAYVDDAIREGLADLNAGRTVMAEQITGILRKAVLEGRKAA